VQPLRTAIASTFYSGLGIEEDDIFVSDGAKCDISRLQVWFYLSLLWFFSSSLFYVLLLCLSSWYARVCIFLALVICKLHHNWLAFARLNILSDGIWGKCNHGSARSIIPGNLCFYKLVVKFEICSTSFTLLSPIFNTFSSHMFLNYAVFICNAWWILIVIIIVRPLSMPLQHFLPTFLFLASVEGTLLWGFS
jgi:hypothetical protein